MEFKKLSDVEVVAEPTESANVLIEENGVIKKAPKTAVGGGMGGSLMLYPYVDDNGTHIDRTYDEIKDVLDNGGVVLMSTLQMVIDDMGGFESSIVTDGVWPLYYGISVETSEGEIIVVFAKAVESSSPILYLKSDNTVGAFESVPGGGPS